VPSRATPITTAGQTSNPVLGSAPEDVPLGFVDDAGALAIVEVPEPVLEGEDDVGVPELCVPDDDVLEPELDPELPEDPDDEPPDFLPPEPLSGSVYCWSPADGPGASAIVGPATAIPTRASSTQVKMRVKRKARVLQLCMSGSPAAALREPVGGASGGRSPGPSCPWREPAKTSVCRIYCTTRSAGQDRDGSC